MAGSLALRRLTVTEFKLFLRGRVGPIWGIGFPLFLLFIFGSIPAFKRPNKVFGGLTGLEIYVPVLVGFVIAMLALNALPTVLAGYREKGILRRLWTTPVGPARVLAAQLVVNLAVTVLTVTLILTVARLAYHVELPRKLAAFAGTTLLATAALISIGLFLAALAPSARAAQATGTILFFPMMFFAGLWLPIAQMPPVLRDISQFTPLGAATQALQDAASGDWPRPLHLVTMAGYAVVFGLAAAKLFRWE